MTAPRRPWYSVLYIQVLIAIAVGIAIGHYFPHIGVALKPLGDGFISLIKMMIAPVIFCTVVHGIGSMRDLKKVGRVGVKTLFYFEAVSTVALALGLLVGRASSARQGIRRRSGDARHPMRSRATSIKPRRWGSSPTSWRSFRIPSSAPSRGATSCRCCSSPSSPASPSRGSGIWASGSTAPSTPWRRSSLASSGSSCGRRRSAPSAPWPSPSAPTGWALSSTWSS